MRRDAGPIFKVLPIAPSTYHDHAARRRDPSRLSARAKRDEALKIEVRRVFEENFRVYAAWFKTKYSSFIAASSLDAAYCDQDHTTARFTPVVWLPGGLSHRTAERSAAGVLAIGARSAAAGRPAIGVEIGRSARLQ
jgi:hypothetical protein